MANGLGMSVRLAPSLQRLLRQGPEPLLAEMSERLQEKVLEQGEDVIREAKDLVPVDTGELRASGAAVLIVASQTEFGVNLSFGGEPGAGNVDGETNAGPVEYAAIVHEDMTAHHPNGGQAKFLEQPWLEEQPRKRAEQAQVIRDVLREAELL